MLATHQVQTKGSFESITEENVNFRQTSKNNSTSPSNKTPKRAGLSPQIKAKLKLDLESSNAAFSKNSGHLSRSRSKSIEQFSKSLGSVKNKDSRGRMNFQSQSMTLDNQIIEQKKPKKQVMIAKGESVSNGLNSPVQFD